MNVIDQIERNSYEATPAQLKQLAATVATGARGGSTYLRILVAACQARAAGNTKSSRNARSNRGSPANTALLDGTHADLYAHIKAGCGSTDPREINRRCTFARSAASTLRGWIARGGDLSKLDVTTVTKRALAAPRATPEERFADRLAKLIRTAERLGMVEQIRAAVDVEPRVVSTRLHHASAH